MMRIVVCAFFLFQRVWVSGQMICDAIKCLEVHEEAVSFRDAKEFCQNTTAELVTEFGSEVWAALDGKSGSYWSGTNSVRWCEWIDLSDNTTRVGTCDSEKKGFICVLSLDSPCPVLSDSKVRYRAPTGADLIQHGLVPAGSTAVASEPGGKYPTSKHICAFGSWIGAPWSCEVERGGCEHACNGTCYCPPGQVLHPNLISCEEDPCASCQHGCGGDGTCVCRRGYQLLADGKSCADVDECAQNGTCSGAPGTQCVNTVGGYECDFSEDFDEDSICFLCEHKCGKVNGLDACVCDQGFRVSRKDPHKCEMHCGTMSCRAMCTQVPGVDEKDWPCRCPEGYILDYNDVTKHMCVDMDECAMDMPCDHQCEDLFGGYRCFCEEGFQLVGLTKCVPSKEEDGSGAEAPHLKAPTAQPAAVPSYVKTGSILGLALFSGLCMALLLLVVRQVSKRCDTLELWPPKRTEVDVDDLQQVTIDTYKMLPVD